MVRPPQYTTLFPYTTLFRSEYGPRKSRRLSPDWILTSGSRAVLLECKTKKLRLGSRLPQFREQFKEDVQAGIRSEEHTSELQSHSDLVCRLLLEKKKKKKKI